MQTKTKKDKDKPNITAHEILGAWVLVLVTLLSNFTHDERRAREAAFINPVKPVYVYAGADDQQPISRNDNENETVHMPTKFDVGLKINAVSGKK